MSEVRHQQMLHDTTTASVISPAEAEQWIKRAPQKNYDEMTGWTSFYSQQETHSLISDLRSVSNWRNPYYYSFEVVFFEKGSERLFQLRFRTNHGNFPIQEMFVLFESGCSINISMTNQNPVEAKNPFGRGIGMEKCSFSTLQRNDYLKYFVNDTPQKIRFVSGRRQFDESLTPIQKIAFKQMAKFFVDQQW